MSYQDYLNSVRPGPAAPTAGRLRQALAKFLASIHANPAGAIAVAELVAGVRRTLQPRYRKRLKRSEVNEALAQLGIPVGIQDRRQVAVGFTLEPPIKLTVDERGRVREVA